MLPAVWRMAWIVCILQPSQIMSKPHITWLVRAFYLVTPRTTKGALPFIGLAWRVVMIWSNISWLPTLTSTPKHLTISWHRYTSRSKPLNTEKRRVLCTSLWVTNARLTLKTLPKRNPQITSSISKTKICNKMFYKYSLQLPERTKITNVAAKRYC
jgi:hypothetical protein